MFMRRAIDLAELGLGLTSPNPVVGCVIVKDGVVIAEGFHKRAGGDHAEIDALRKIGFKAEGCDVYVTLEPCSHTGKTGPCCEALVAVGVSRVFVGMKDPFGEVAGKGMRYLEDNGVDVVLCEEQFGEELKQLNQPFLKSCVDGALPYVVLKVAMSLDGKISDIDGRSQWITGDEARGDAKVERSYCDAVLVGAETVRKDDCTLGVAKGFDKSILRVILSNGELDKSFKVFRDDNVVVLGGDLRDILATLRDSYDVKSVFVEGGRKVHEQFIEAGLVDRMLVYYGGVWLGRSASLESLGFALGDARRLTSVKCEVLSGDVKLSGCYNFY